MAFISRTEANWSKEEIGAITALVRRATLVLQNFSFNVNCSCSHLDPITEVCNTEAFDRILNKRLERCRQTGVSLGLGIIAIEGFEALSTRIALPDLAIIRQRIASTMLQRLRDKQLIGCLDQARFAYCLRTKQREPYMTNSCPVPPLYTRKCWHHCMTCPGWRPVLFCTLSRDAASSRELWTMGFSSPNRSSSEFFNRDTKAKSA